MSEMIKIILFVLTAYLMGFIAAIPVGGTQLEISRRSLKGYLSSAMMIVIASVLSDGMYGAIALFGITPFLQYPSVVAIFEFVNALILILLGIWAIRESRDQRIDNQLSGKILNNRKVSFLTGFSLAVTNPLMILWWLLGARFLNDIGLVEKFNSFHALLFLFSGTLGIGSYLTLLLIGVYKAKRFFSELSIKRVSIAFGVFFMGLAAYFIYHSTTVLLKSKVLLHFFPN